MAQVIVQKNPPNTILSTFLGLNESINGDTQIKLGESPSMENFRITSDYKLRSREGYQQTFYPMTSSPIRGFWYGEVNGETNGYFVQDSNAYKTDLTAVTTVTTSTTSTDPLLFTWADHGLQEGVPIRFSGLGSPFRLKGTGIASEYTIIVDYDNNIANNMFVFGTGIAPNAIISSFSHDIPNQKTTVTLDLANTSSVTGYIVFRSNVYNVIKDGITYYVKYINSNTFNISLTFGGASIQNGAGQVNAVYNNIFCFEVIGSFSADRKTHLFPFNEKLFFQNGNELKTYSNLPNKVATITATSGVPLLFNLPGHLFGVNRKINLTGTLPSPLVSNTDYYVIPIDAFQFYVAASEDGTPINATTTGSFPNITVIPKLSSVGGYIPTIVVGRTSGSSPGTPGVLFEQLNLLNNYRICQFSGDNNKTYSLTEQNINNVLFVTVNGIVITDYTVNTTTGLITFGSFTPGVGSIIRIAYSKGTNTERTSDRNKIYNCRASMIYGGKNDTRVHAFGNENILYKSTRFTSGIPFDLSTSAEYFPYNLNADIGDRSEAITDIVIQYDRQVIFKERSTFYSYIEYVNDEASFPVYPLNDKVGNTPFHQVRIIENNPFSVHTGVYQWLGTNVRDERNAALMSERIQYSFDNISNLPNVITHDFEEQNEYWLANGKDVYIYGYVTNTWYKFTLNHTPTFFLTIGKYVYFSTTDGYIMQFGNDNLGFPLLTDNGFAFNKYWESGFYDFRINNIRKYMDKLWISLQPSDDQEIDIYYRTNESNEDILVSNLQYDIFTFFNFNFNDLSFSTLVNPQPFMRKLKAKKFVYFKLILKNDSDESRATILNITLPVRVGGEVK